ncbi:hypothetical protein IQ26_02023 [Mesorhizobium tianshanense]|uniref:Uncharacterized protein n=1 Tax=Mesorhizobium tianshanense TaxID=39844 RepID=A0A562P4A5_9HYPH|nr:hypothetical protein IQ26_02023 [Mesorhizobium tianshanense]
MISEGGASESSASPAAYLSCHITQSHKIDYGTGARFNPCCFLARNRNSRTSLVVNCVSEPVRQLAGRDGWRWRGLVLWHRRQQCVMTAVTNERGIHCLADLPTDKPSFASPTIAASRNLSCCSFWNRSRMGLQIGSQPQFLVPRNSVERIASALVLGRLRHAGLADRRDVPVVGAAAAAQYAHGRK